MYRSVSSTKLGDEAVGVVPERGMRGADALRRAGRSGGVDQAQVVPRLDRPRQRRPLLGGAVEQLLQRDRPPRKLDARVAAHEDDRLEGGKVEPDEALDETAVRDQHLGLRDPDRVLEVAATRGEVERRVDAARRVRPEPGAQHIGTRRHPDGDVVAHGDAAMLAQAVRGPPRLARRVCPGPRLVLEQQQRLVRSLRRALREQLGKNALFPCREAERGGWRLSCRHRILAY